MSSAISKTSDATFPRLMFGVWDDKGGVGKSFTAATLAAMLEEYGINPLLIDADATNSTTASTHEAMFADASEVNFRGTLLVAIRRFKSGVGQIVLDTAARDEGFVKNHLPWLVRELEKVSARLVVFRPITPEPATQQNAIEFAQLARPLGVPVVFVHNYGQRRGRRDFEPWLQSKALASALASGVVTCDLADAGAEYGDLARRYGLSLADVAFGRFQRAGDAADKAAAAFDENVQTWLSIWLSEQTESFHAAIIKALAR